MLLGQEFLRDLWCDMAGVNTDVREYPRLPDQQEIEDMQWSKEFEQFMKNRLVMGAFRYGMVNTKKSKSYSHMSSVQKRIEKYQETGNLENLVDVANLCLLEFLHSQHPHKHFGATDDAIHSEKR